MLIRRVSTAGRATRARLEAACPHLFHTTSYAKVARIAQQGLRPDCGGSTWGADWYKDDPQRLCRVYLADGYEAARFWFETTTDILYQHSDDWSEHSRRLRHEELVPVLLRVRQPPRGIGVDEYARNTAVWVDKPIPPENLVAWKAGVGWVPVGTDLGPADQHILDWDEWLNGGWEAADSFWPPTHEEACAPLA